MLFSSLLAATVACSSVMAFESNGARFKRGLPPLPPSRIISTHRKRQGPSAIPVSVPDVQVTGLMVQLDSETSPTFQFASTTNREYQDYDLTDLASPGMAGTFVFSGHYSTQNNRALYFFKPSNALADKPYMVNTFNSPTSTYYDLEGVYFSQAAGGTGPYGPTMYPSVDTFYIYTEAAVYQIDKSDPAKPVLTFLTMDNEMNEYESSLCVDGLGGETQLPFLYANCEPSDMATVILKLA